MATRVIVIPARLASERLPGKLLLADTGRPLIQHTYERCAAVRGGPRVVVAADGDRMAEAVRAFGGEVVVTDPELPTGTDRVAVACEALALTDDDLVVNVQGDEPEIDPGHIETLFELLESEPSDGRRASVATLATARRDADGFENPNRVKVVCDRLGFALYFSRAAIPFERVAQTASSWLCHVGIYGFRPGALARFRREPMTTLESIERLEQLRFLELGLAIRVACVEGAAPGIDTRDDYLGFLERVRRSR